MVDTISDAWIYIYEKKWGNKDIMFMYWFATTIVTWVLTSSFGCFDKISKILKLFGWYHIYPALSLAEMKTDLAI